jgi:hypothetical protein
MTGLVLIDEGYRPKDAIELMRSLRSPYVLANETFERYLLSEKPTSGAHGAGSSRSRLSDQRRRPSSSSVNTSAPRTSSPSSTTSAARAS